MYRSWSLSNQGLGSCDAPTTVTRISKKRKPVLPRRPAAVIAPSSPRRRGAKDGAVRNSRSASYRRLSRFPSAPDRRTVRPPRTHAACTARGTRATDRRCSASSSFELRTPWVINDIQGAALESVAPSLYRVSLSARTRDAEPRSYQRSNVILRFTDSDKHAPVLP